MDHDCTSIHGSAKIKLHVLFFIFKSQGYLAMANFNAASYVYLDPDNPDGSSIENDEFDEAAGVV